MREKGKYFVLLHDGFVYFFTSAQSRDKAKANDNYWRYEFSACRARVRRVTGAPITRKTDWIVFGYELGDLHARPRDKPVTKK